ncbi:hypothetical protein EVAR_71167_1 [Eumeta japonica]|uniref:Integrase catalytic domain-containing protein n=1 Tax=Eumeta variegata TaxID=151549 RepID=A0A4C1ZM53_EUMVA|nr:hypothetical protein EVAR_71167_1 [Eumeta japonica]
MRVISSPRPSLSQRGGLREYAPQIEGIFPDKKTMRVFTIPNQETATLTEKLVNDSFSRFEIPLEFHIDHGSNFGSQLSQKVFQILDVHKTRTSAYHPQSKSMVERRN